MFTVEQYRAKAMEYSNLVRIANSPNEVSEFQRLERSYATLADNAQWAIDNYEILCTVRVAATNKLQSEAGAGHACPQSPTASPEGGLGRNPTR
jgi:hypothetical protein